MFFFPVMEGSLTLKLTVDGRRVVTAFLSGQPWLMLNKSRCNCQVQRIHSKNRLCIECIIVSRTVPQEVCVCGGDVYDKSILFEFSLP